MKFRPETTKLLEENIGRTLNGINCSNIFGGMSPKVKEEKAKINYRNLKAFAQQRKLSTKQKDNIWNGRKYSQRILYCLGHLFCFLQLMTQVVAAAPPGDRDSADLSPNLGCYFLIPFLARPHSHMSGSLLGCPLKSHTVSWSSCSQSWFLQSVPAPAGAVPLQPLVSAAPTVAHRHPLSPSLSTVAPISLSLETLD